MSSHLMPVWHQEERKRIGTTEKPTVLHLASSSKETLQIHTHICMYVQPNVALSSPQDGLQVLTQRVKPSAFWPVMSCSLPL